MKSNLKSTRIPKYHVSLEINTLEELALHEEEIVKFINKHPKLGQLFLLHPLLLLSDIKINLSEQVIDKIIRENKPSLMLSKTPYFNLKNTRSKSQTEVVLSKLFQILK